MRTPLARALAAAALAVGGAGCAYFNAMYNANHFAHQAEQSERAGRNGEARERWQSAAIHAESLTAQHPKSRWVGDALLVRGRAMVHLEYWSDAVTVLEEAARRALRPEQRYEALALLGQANLAIGRYAEAWQALDTAVRSAQPAVEGDAYLYRGRALLALGKPDSALADLRRSIHPHARYDLARVELMVGDTAAAGAVYDALAPSRPYVERDWRSSLDSLARAGASRHAARLVDILVSRTDLSGGEKARLLLDDAARRLAAADTAGATGRLQAVTAVAHDSAEAYVAAVELSRLAIASAAGDSDLALERGRLQALAAEGAEAGMDARAVLRTLGAVDSLGAAASAPDAYWFQRAEILRDSLHAGRLAALAFAEMARRFPESPWTAKGLVAAIAAGHPAADSLRALLAGRYAQSPYAMAAAGGSGGADAYAALEDSLRRTLLSRAPARTVPAGRRADADAEDESVGRRAPRESPARPDRRPGEPGAPAPASPRPNSGPPKPQEPST